MTMSHQIIDEPLILTRPSGAATVGNARGLHDRRIVAHVVDDADKAAIQHRQRLVQYLLQGRHGGAPGRPGLGALTPTSSCCSGVSRIPSSTLEDGTSRDCLGPPAVLSLHCRATDYGDKRLVK